MDMKVKRTLTQCALTVMVNSDVQNTEADYENMEQFVSQLVLDYPLCTQADLNSLKDVVEEARIILEPLWEFYFDNLHDGYNVTTRGENS